MIQCCERQTFRFLFSFFLYVYLSLFVPLSLCLSFFITFVLTLSSPSFSLCFPLVDLWYPLTLAPCGAVSYAIGPDASSTDRNRELVMCGHFSTTCPRRCRNVAKKMFKASRKQYHKIFLDDGGPPLSACNFIFATNFTYVSPRLDSFSDQQIIVLSNLLVIKNFSIW